MSNTHLIPDSASELQALLFDLCPACLVSTTPPVAPVSSLTIAAFATKGYVRDGANLVYVDQAAAPVTLSGADGVYWLALHRNTSAAVALWTRQPGTHYLWRSNPTAPPAPAGGFVFAFLTIVGSIITAVTLIDTAPMPVAWRLLLQLGSMSVQNAANVLITGGFISALSNLGVIGSSAFDAPTLVVDSVNHRVGIGAATPLFPLHVAGEAYFPTRVGIGTGPSATHSLLVAGGGNSMFQSNLGVGNADPTAFTLQVNGTAGKPGGGSWGDTSSQHFKKNVRAIPGALGLLLQLQGRRFQWDEPEHIRVLGEGDYFGFLVEEVEDVIPSWVSPTEDGEQALTIRGFEALAVEAIRGMAARILQLEQRVTALEAAQP